MRTDEILEKRLNLPLTSGWKCLLLNGALAVAFFAFFNTALCENRSVVSWSENGHSYELITSSVSWTEAETAARSLTVHGASGYLASITSKAEQDFVYSSFAGYGLHAAWIGLTADPAYGGAGNPGIGGSGAPYWVWTSGEPTIYVNWLKAENGYGYNEPTRLFDSEFYTELVFANTDGTPGRWNNLPNAYFDGAARYYLVEFDTTVIPEPSSSAMLFLGMVCLALRRIARSD